MLKFIGNGSAFNTKLGNNSAYIKDDNYLFLIDCGSNVFDRLKSSGILGGVKNIEVLITHFHPDHIASLGDLIFYSHYVIGKDVIVYTPEGEGLANILTSMGVSSALYDMVQFKVGKFDFLLGLDIDIKPVITRHVDDLACYGYLLKFNDIVEKDYKFGDKVEYSSRLEYYSGDSNIIPEEIMDIFPTLDKLYQDTCSAHYDGNVHLSLLELQKYIEPTQRHRVYCMHLDNKFDREYAESLGFNVTKNHKDILDEMSRNLPECLPFSTPMPIDWEEIDWSDPKWEGLADTQATHYHIGDPYINPNEEVGFPIHKIILD